MKAYGGEKGAPLILNLVTRWRCGQLHVLAVFPIAKRETGTHYVRGWAKPSTGKGIIGDTFFLSRYSPSRSLITILTTLNLLPQPLVGIKSTFRALKNKISNPKAQEPVPVAVRSK